MRSRFAPPQPFSCGRHELAVGTIQVSVVGEVDLCATSRLNAELIAAQGDADLVLVDLRRIAFADGTLVHVLIEADARSEQSRSRLAVLQGEGVARRVLELTAHRHQLNVIDRQPRDRPSRPLPSRRSSDWSS
jgi:anti-anti-sigma regulatory factor